VTIEAARDAVMLAQANIDDCRARGHLIPCVYLANLERAQYALRRALREESPTTRRARETRWYFSPRDYR
jgi:hypothetical protein